jgi:sugar-phosphatase
MALYNETMGQSLIISAVRIPCQGFLFDMDGILISSLGSVERSWTRWAKMRGIDPAYAISVIHGRRAIDSVRRLRPDLDAEAELKIIEDFEVEDNDGLVVLPGVLELLRVLPAERWTVVTSATERLARVRMAAGGVPVPGRLVTAETVIHGKPHPEPYVAGANLLGFAPGACVVFEDSASGARAGREAGCIVIATTFSHAADELEAAHYLVRDLTGMRVERQAEGDGVILTFTPLGG